MKARPLVRTLAIAIGSLATLPALAAPVTPPLQPEIHAIVIGWNGGRPGLPSLRYADDDAVRFALFFAGLGRDPGHVQLLTEIDGDTRAALAQAGLRPPDERPPTRSALFDAITRVGRSIRAPSSPAGSEASRVLYVVYAGHGLSGRVLLKPEVAAGPDAEAAITGAEIRSALAELARLDPGLKMFLFVDACRSESLFSERGGDSGPDLGAQIAELDRRAAALPLGVLTAATTGKPAGEVRALSAGYFSHVLGSALAGAADSDGDEVVSFGELAAFVAFHTQKLTGQLPWFDPPGGDLGASAIDHRGRRPRLVIPRAAAGHFVIESPVRPPVFAEVFKDDRRDLKLALPVGRYRVVRREADGHALESLVNLTAGDEVDVSLGSWSETSAAARGDSAGDEASDQPLGFTAAFTPDVVSTLAAGYHAGRRPSATALSSPQFIGIAPAVGGVPLGLPGVEVGLAIRYRRHVGDWFAGARAAYLGSAQRADNETYRLHRSSLAIEGGLHRRWGRTVGAGLWLAGGVASVLRRSASGASGDPLGPVAGGGLGVDWQLPGPWVLFAEGRYLVQWIAVDGQRRVDGEPTLELGLGWRF